MENPYQIYVEEFEATYIKQATEYYRREATVLMRSISTREYIRKVMEALEKELETCKRLCEPSSWDKVIKECENEMIEAYKERIQKEFEPILHSWNLSVLF